MRALGALDTLVDGLVHELEQLHFDVFGDNI